MRRCTMHNKNRFFVLLAALLLAGYGNASALVYTTRDGASVNSCVAVPWIPRFDAVVLTADECEGIFGGDVRMFLNAARTNMTVKVLENDAEGRLGKIPPTEVYEIQVHNRLVDTINAPFLPTPETSRILGSIAGLTSKPNSFPVGTWNITSIAARDDQYGPYMIRTNATGTVDVFRSQSNGSGAVYIGTYQDTGYGIHANTRPFETSQSYGCIVARKEDIVKLVNTINKDRREDTDAKQTINVGPVADW
jgi:hypothetical protein